MVYRFDTDMLTDLVMSSDVVFGQPLFANHSGVVYQTEPNLTGVRSFVSFGQQISSFAGLRHTLFGINEGHNLVVATTSIAKVVEVDDISLEGLVANLDCDENAVFAVAKLDGAKQVMRIGLNDLIRNKYSASAPEDRSRVRRMDDATMVQILPYAKKRVAVGYTSRDGALFVDILDNMLQEKGRLQVADKGMANMRLVYANGRMIISYTDNSRPNIPVNYVQFFNPGISVPDEVIRLGNKDRYSEEFSSNMDCDRSVEGLVSTGNRAYVVLQECSEGTPQLKFLDVTPGIRNFVRNAGKLFLDRLYQLSASRSHIYTSGNVDEFVVVQAYHVI